MKHHTPRNRHERRGQLVKLRKAKKALAVLAEKEAEKLRNVKCPVTKNPEVAEILIKEGRGVGLDKT